MRTDWAISAAGHAAVLAFGLVSLASTTPLNSAAPLVIAVNIVSDDDTSHITQGHEDAPKVVQPAPVVDKTAEPKPVKDPTPKASDKPEITTAAAEQTPPPPETKPDAIADAIKRDEAKKPEPPKKHVETPMPPKKPPPPQPRFDANKIAALLDKRDPRREAATGAAINHTASLGAPTGSAMTLSQSELDALRAQIQACWSPPVGVMDAKGLVVTVRLMLKQDGSLSAEPRVTNQSGNSLFQIAAESALRAIRRCAPYRLPVAKYEVWKDVEVDFDPRDMFRG